MNNLHAILKDYWGYDRFRPLQEEIIQAVLAKKDCLALLPTGGGKSLCFQVPTLASPGLCLVVSPLIALMKDQVEHLRRKNITAFHIHSGMNRKEVINTLALAAGSNCKFLYVSPERLETVLFKEYLPALGVKLIAVDEAHCISQWGYDFRPAYLTIAQLREELPNVPVLALTASATVGVQKDICDRLSFAAHTIFRQSFERPNLSYSTFVVPSKINKLVDILSKVNGSAIVYCNSRRRTKEISALLNMHGISADHYHAGIGNEQRNARQDAWVKNEIRVMVSTNAFGMGIDKPDVRVVIHVDSPDCLESYYQEAGRAGRDGKRSYAVLLYTEKDKKELKSQSSVRYPAIDRIRQVYHDLMNHLQIPSGCGEGQYYEVDIHHFCKQFGLQAKEVFPVLQTLEQEQLLYFTEQVFTPAKLQVIAGRRELEAYEEAHPLHERTIKCLLRNYEGIMDMPVNIYEKAIAGMLKIKPDDLEQLLIELHAQGIVQYEPQKEKPQVCLLQNRVKAQELHIDMQHVKQRKKLYEQRLESMLQYISDTAVCRSVMIGNYFGDREIRDCGICDVCLNKKKKVLSQAEFEQTHARLVSIVGASSLGVSEILQHDKDLSKEKLMEVIRFLQAENKISVNEYGAIALVAG